MKEAAGASCSQTHQNLSASHVHTLLESLPSKHTHTHKNTQCLYMSCLLLSLMLLVPIDSATIISAVCKIILDSQKSEICMCVLSFITLRQCRISTQTQWCNSTCKMWYFRAIYLDYASQPKYEKALEEGSPSLTPLSPQCQFKLYYIQ